MTVIKTTLIFLLVATCAAHAQVKQSGQITPSHGVQWITDGVIADTGAPATGGLNSAVSPGQIYANYTASTALPSGNNWMAAGATASPTYISPFQDFVNTSGGTTADIRCMWNPGTGGAAGCRPWMTLNQATGAITLLPTSVQATNAAFGSYAGVNAPPTNGVIISGAVGINTTTPGSTSVASGFACPATGSPGGCFDVGGGVVLH